MRSMSLLLWIITATLLCYIVIRVTKNKASKLSVYFLLAFLPVIVSISVYTRMYSLTIPLTLGSMIALEQYILKKKRIYLILFSFLSLIACYTDNTSLFAYIGLNIFYSIYLLNTQNLSIKNCLLKNIEWFICQLIVFILFIPWLVIIFIQINGHLSSNLSWVEPFNLITFFKIFSIITDLNVFDFTLVSFFTGLICCPIVIYVYYINLKEFIKNPRLNILKNILGVVSISTVIIIILGSLKNSLIMPRTFVFVILFFPILALPQFKFFRNSQYIKGFKFSVVFFILLFVIIFNSFYGAPLNDPQLGEIVNMVKNDSSNNLVIVNQDADFNYPYTQVKYLFKDTNKIIKINDKFDTGSYVIDTKKDFINVENISSSFYYFTVTEEIRPVFPCYEIKHHKLINESLLHDYFLFYRLCKYSSYTLD